MTRCACGQYPDVCRRYGHAGPPAEPKVSGRVTMGHDQATRIGQRVLALAPMLAADPRAQIVMEPASEGRVWVALKNGGILSHEAWL
jgi:hypothetical protein